MPHAFTEHGVIMAASVLNSKKAVDVSVAIVRAFVRMRELIVANEKMAAQLRDLEDRVDVQELNTILLMDQVKNLKGTVVKKPRPDKIGCPHK